jgi:L-alanine-DL-glutamate epimerase-like enolase superfamily enzyme
LQRGQGGDGNRAFDIVGKALGAPVCDLLGGRVRDEIPLSFSVANPVFSQDADLVRQLCTDGIRLFQVKTGISDHAEDLLAQPFAVRDGRVQAPSGPGRGIEADADKRRRYAA